MSPCGLTRHEPSSRPPAVLALLASVVVALPAGAGTAGAPVLRATTVLSCTTDQGVTLTQTLGVWLRQP